MRRVKIGDVIEIPTTKGLCYAHYTHDIPDFCDLIQVKEGFYRERPYDLNDVVNNESTIIIFFPFGPAVYKKIFEVVDTIDVPRRFQKFPTFRVPGINIKNGKTKEWRFWNGVKTWPRKPVCKLTKEQINLPIKEIWNDTLLIERIESGYTPADDPTTIKGVLAAQ